MELSFDMSFALIHPTYRKIMIQHDYLLNLIDSVSYEMEEQFKKEEKEGYEWAEQKAKEVSGGEELIYNSEYGQNCSAVYSHLEDLFEMQNMFYKSMLCTIYSYYESIITLIVKDKAYAEKIPEEAIKNHLYTNFNNEVQGNFDYLYNKIRHIRNLLVHNYNGTPRQDQITAALDETQRKIGFKMYDADSYGIEKAYVTMILDKVYRVLIAISKELGYKN